MKKLPKQWNHWCKLAGFTSWKPKSKYDRHFKFGRGVSLLVEEDCSYMKLSKYMCHPRLSLIDLVVEAPLPKTEKEFLTVIESMITKHKTELAKILKDENV